MSKKRKIKSIINKGQEDKANNPVITESAKLKLDVLRTEKHHRAICVVNYKGGV